MHNRQSCCAVDHDNEDYPVFESGAILQYLGEKSGKFYPQDFNKRHEVNQWLFFQNAGAHKLIAHDMI